MNRGYPEGREYAGPTTFGGAGYAALGPGPVGGAPVRHRCGGCWVDEAGCLGTPRPRSVPCAPRPIGVPLMKKALLAALAALLVVALTACGSGKSDSKDKVTLSKDEKTAVANLQKALTESTTGGLTATEGKCVATDFVDTVGLAK